MADTPSWLLEPKQMKSMNSQPRALRRLQCSLSVTAAVRFLHSIVTFLFVAMVLITWSNGCTNHAALYLEQLYTPRSVWIAPLTKPRSESRGVDRGCCSRSSPLCGSLCSNAAALPDVRWVKVKTRETKTSRAACRSWTLEIGLCGTHVASCVPLWPTFSSFTVSLWCWPCWLHPSPLWGLPSVSSFSLDLEHSLLLPTSEQWWLTR